MKIFSRKILPVRFEEDLFANDIAGELGKSKSWFSRVERGILSISPETERQILILMRKMGALQREAAIAKRKLAAETFVPHHAPHRRSEPQEIGRAGV